MSDKSPGHWCGKGVAEESQGEEQRGDHSPALMCCPIQQAPRGPFASNPLVSDKETGSGRPGQVTMLSAIQGHGSEDVPPWELSLGEAACRLAGKCHCSRGGKVPLVHPGNTKRLPYRALAESWARTAAVFNYPYSERVDQPSSLALDNQLTPAQSLHTASPQAQKNLGSGTLLQNDDAV